jgi:L-aminopeptidase/D-esterase-like protein
VEDAMGEDMIQKRIEITEIEGFAFGHADDAACGTGCTVVVCADGAVAGVDVRGGGPATRETDLLAPGRMIERIHAVVLSGGSAFGLDAAAGVMAELESRNIGHATNVGVVPIVCGASLVDLSCGGDKVRPNKTMGQAACEKAFDANSRFTEGNVGAGTGATVGKYRGSGRMMKSGLGVYAVQVGALQVGAVSAVNALGDVLDAHSGRIVAGLLTEDGGALADTLSTMYEDAERKYDGKESVARENTTLVCVVTNAKLTKPQAGRVATLAHDGMARVIRPVHTSVDGDAIFAMAFGEVSADVDIVACLAADVTAEAIGRAVCTAKPAYGLKAACDFL